MGEPETAEKTENPENPENPGIYTLEDLKPHNF
jgi:hypothetical protein